MISRAHWLGMTLAAVLAAGFVCSNALAVCEESNKTQLGSDDFFVVCQSSTDSPISYALTQFISDETVHGVLRFRAGRQGFFCASHPNGKATCHISNFGLFPRDAMRSSTGDRFSVVDLAEVVPVKDPEASYPRSNRLEDDAVCYFALKGRSITLGIDRHNPFGLSRCLVFLEAALKRRG